MRKIYLDYAATTPIDPEVLEEMHPFLTDKFGNASSIHSFGREARAGLDESRERIASLVGAHPAEIYFVGSGTEANNYALKGIASVMMGKGNRHIITSKIEHHSILETCEYLKELGHEITYLDVDSNGTVNQNDVLNAIRPDTGIVSVMHANNEIGTINPVSGISKIAHESNIVFHTDAIQSFGKVEVDVNRLGVDMLSLSAHKIYGPKGIGAIFIRRGIEITALIHGGGQERGKRAGTENVALAVGFAKAAEIICRRRESQQLLLLKNSLIRLLKERFTFLIFNGHPTDSLPNIVSISFDSRKIDIDGEALIMNLDIHGIAASSGSACTSGSIKPSHVLLAMNRDELTTKATVRFSIGRNTTLQEITDTVDVLNTIVKRIGKIRN